MKVNSLCLALSLTLQSIARLQSKRIVVALSAILTPEAQRRTKHVSGCLIDLLRGLRQPFSAQFLDILSLVPPTRSSAASKGRPSP
jgi:hypothetical protein